jgi:hypothetical protein
MFNRIINWFQSLFRFKTEPEQKVLRCQDYEVARLWRERNDDIPRFGRYR